MKVSVKWLNEYVDLSGKTPEEISATITDCGLEVEGIEQHQSIKGGLAGLLIAEVVEKWKHPNADKLNLTKVNFGGAETVQVVCGAPNVEAGQKVVFAPVGTMVHPVSGEAFEIKKGKIRGEESLGMICAQDEIGLGTEHDGIIVLSADAPVGEALVKYLKLESDTVLEVAILPNRCDAASHIGVAKDLVATLNSSERQAGRNAKSFIIWPELKLDVNAFPSQNIIKIEIAEPELCPRYTGLSISGVKIGESPEWLKQRLQSIGLKSINNVVDITNFVLFETGQPLHAFDADTIKGGKVVVKKAAKGQKFVTLDSKERELTGEELMICNGEEPMVIAGVFGGLNSGVTASTQNIFLESAYFNPVSVRKTSKLHNIKTDSSFRFERGTDPEFTVKALLRAADLICEIAGGKVSSAIQDVYPTKVSANVVNLDWAYLDLLLGAVLDRNEVKAILTDLGFGINKDENGTLSLTVPTSKNDVTRPADVIEEIVRIYGANNIPMPGNIRMPADLPVFNSTDKLRRNLAEALVANGLSEAMNNSLTNVTNAEILGGNLVVNVLNPLSSELSIMRPSLVFGLLESVRYNINRKVKTVGLFEFGKTYFKKVENPQAPSLLPDQRKPLAHKETNYLSIILSGNAAPEHFSQKEAAATFYSLKKHIAVLADKTGLPLQLVTSKETLPIFAFSFDVVCHNKVIGQGGQLATSLTKKFDVDQAVFYAEINCDAFFKLANGVKTKFKEIPRFPEVRRDLALLIDRKVKYAELENVALQTERKLLKAVNVFDVYEGKNLPEGKKSYALSFILQDNEATLTDQTIDKAMKRLTEAFTREFGAELR